jgi:hypothetical protein
MSFDTMSLNKESPYGTSYMLKLNEANQDIELEVTKSNPTNRPKIILEGTKNEPWRSMPESSDDAL